MGGLSYVEKVHKEKKKPISGGSSFLGKDTRPNPRAKKPAPCKKYVPRKKSSVLEALPKVIKILFRRGNCRVGDQTLKVKGQGTLSLLRIEEAQIGVRMGSVLPTGRELLEALSRSPQERKLPRYYRRNTGTQIQWGS